MLTVTSRLLAPIMPFVTDWLHRELVGTSVHLAPYVRAGAGAAIDDALESAMADIRRWPPLAAPPARPQRSRPGTRSPAWYALCRERAARVWRVSQALAPLLQAELNVKGVEWLSSGDSLVTPDG